MHQPHQPPPFAQPAGRAAPASKPFSDVPGILLLVSGVLKILFALGGTVIGLIVAASATFLAADTSKTAKGMGGIAVVGLGLLALSAVGVVVMLGPVLLTGILDLVAAHYHRKRRARAVTLGTISAVLGFLNAAGYGFMCVLMMVSRELGPGIVMLLMLPLPVLLNVALLMTVRSNAPHYNG